MTPPDPIQAITHHRPPGPIARTATLPFVALIWLYRITLSPFVGGQCKHTPTCSRYALEAYRIHGPIRGSLLTMSRIVRCNPVARGGYDPVPLNNPPKSASNRTHAQANTTPSTDAPSMAPEPTNQ